MSQKTRRIRKFIVMVTFVFALVSAGTTTAVNAKGKGASLSAACAAAMKATGNAKKIAYKSTTPSDFEGISFKHKKKVASVFFVTSDNSAYNICVAKAKSAKGAAALYKSFAQLKKNQINGLYFKTDFTKAEQNVMKNAIYGKKGNYVWYIAMSSKKKNLAGQKALQKKIFAR